MKKIKISTAIFLSSFTLLNYSCKKNDTGGHAEIHAKVYHNGAPINHSTIYIKFDTHHAPDSPTTDYNLKAHGEESDNHVHIEDLRPGEYYLFAVGTNTATGKTVKGGTSIEISWKERKETLEAEIQTSE
jgi:hypothetical protein